MSVGYVDCGGGGTVLYTASRAAAARGRRWWWNFEVGGRYNVSTLLGNCTASPWAVYIAADAVANVSVTLPLSASGGVMGAPRHVARSPAAATASGHSARVIPGPQCRIHAAHAGLPPLQPAALAASAAVTVAGGRVLPVTW
jgi:hypothetical protein